MSIKQNHSKTAGSILWVARIWSSLTLAFVLFFLIAHIFGEDESGVGIQTFGEIIQFICFPISTVLGLAIAFKFEKVGGIVSVTGLLILFILRPDLIISPIAIMIIPGLLFIAFWYLTRDKSE